MQIGGERYRMLDTVRHYAQEKMAEGGDEVAVRGRHLDFYLALAEKARPELAGPDQGAWLSRLDLERENLLSAHSWGRQVASTGNLCPRLAHALRPYWINRGLLTLGLQVTLEVLACAGMEKRHEARCRALFGAGQLCFFMGRDAEATTYLAESLAIAREAADAGAVARILQPLGMARLGVGDVVTARAHLEEAVGLASE
jgi:non-specific serine/threonine protein kinase